ncbi:protein XRP2-like [Lytechinus pictus]|uniref:protein XRP2-like n=1 Tax=Lytechinus pictus TaxID=7653 RepID=UPI0030B9FFED
MGCCFSGGDGKLAEQEEPAPQFSWEKREKLDIKDFTFADLKGEEVGKVPGKINGQRFIIKNCEDCTIYLFDHMATITVDDCTNCRLFVGPNKGSIFLRNCSSMKCVIACQQFRTRDCKSIETLLHCDSKPIIESSIKMKFGCFQFYYPELYDQFKAAGLKAFSNTWSNIHDYTPVPGEENWTLLPEDLNVEEFLPLPKSEELVAVGASLDPEKSVVPITHGTRRRVGDLTCLMLVFRNEHSDERIRAIIREVHKSSDCVLLNTRQTKLNEQDVMRMFGGNPVHKEATKKGLVTSLEINGTDTINRCRSIIEQVAGDCVIYLSADQEAASRDHDNWVNFIDSQMTM